MEYQRTALLVVLTLLQLCQAENIPPQWYSAKITDDFQPQPISEIFTNEPAFSTTKPIVVTQSSNSISDDDQFSSTVSPLTSQSESSKFTQETFSSTTSLPAGALYQQPRLNHLNPSQVDILPQLNYLQPIVSSYMPLSVYQLPRHNQKHPIEPQFPLVTDIPELSSTTLFQPQTQTTLFQPQTQTTLAQPISSTTPSPILTVTNPPPAPPSASLGPPSSNYFLIYQQAHQSAPIPPFSPPPRLSIPEVTIRQSTPTTVSLPPRTSEAIFTTPEIPKTSISTTTSLPTTFLSTTPLPISTLSSLRVTITPSSTLGLSTGYSTSTTPIPSLLPNGLNKKASGISYPLKIRVVAPSGSITNVHINPATGKPVTTQQTTTRRPSTTRRTSKPKKNSYDRCLDGCKKVKDAICAAPLSHREIDPKKLRGFPSVCHMACHNSYRKDPFEKVMEGSCSKLRTRIRLIDSRTKLKKNELRKNEYSVEPGRSTIIELTSLV